MAMLDTADAVYLGSDSVAQLCMGADVVFGGGNTIHVDSAAAGGGDGTEATPYNTVAAALAVAQPHDRVLLKRGSVFNEEVLVTTAKVRVGAYGTGRAPVIDRCTEPSGLTFNDGFQSETSSFNTNWGGKTESGSSTVTLETTAPLRGTQSMKYTHTSGGLGYLTKTVASTGEIYIQLKVKIKKLVTGAAFGNHTILRLIGGNLFLIIGHDGTPENGVKVRFQSQGVNVTDTRYWGEGAELRIEVRFKAGTGTCESQCWVNGVSIASSTGQTNANQTTGFYLGNQLNGANGLGTGSELLFDDIKVSAGANPIGRGTYGDDGIEAQADDVVFEDLEVRSAGQYLAKLRDCYRGKIRRCHLHNSLSTGVVANIGGGNHMVRDCLIENTGLDAAYGAGSGVHWLSTTTGVNRVLDTQFRNIGDEQGDHGIYDEGGEGNLAQGNLFEWIAGFAVKHKVGSPDGRIFRNRGRYCRTGFANVDNATNIAIDHNSWHNCGRFPTGLSPYTGVWITGTGSARVRNNAQLGSGIGIQVDANATLIEEDGNVFSSTAQFGNWHASAKTTLAAWQAASGTGANDVSSDPLFTSVSTGDLTLTGSSPAIDAGIVIDGVNDDHLGDAPDAGYVETA